MKVAERFIDAGTTGMHSVAICEDDVRRSAYLRRSPVYSARSWVLPTRIAITVWDLHGMWCFRLYAAAWRVVSKHDIRIAGITRRSSGVPSVIFGSVFSD